MNDVIAQKIETLRKCLKRIESKLPHTVDDFLDDLDAQDIISINLERTVQSAVDIAAQVLSASELPPMATMGEGFSQLGQLGIIPADLAVRLRKAIGFRNISVHEYQKINWHMVYAIGKNHLQDFRDFIVYVTKSHI